MQFDRKTTTDMNEFERFASLCRGISPMTLHRYGNAAQNSYINPTIIAEKSGQNYDKVFADMDRDYWRPLGGSRIRND